MERQNYASLINFSAHLQLPFTNPKHYAYWFYLYFTLPHQWIPPVLWPFENLCQLSHSIWKQWEVEMLWNSLITSFTWTGKMTESRDDFPRETNIFPELWWHLSGKQFLKLFLVLSHRYGPKLPSQTGNPGSLLMYSVSSWQLY